MLASIGTRWRVLLCFGCAEIYVAYIFHVYSLILFSDGGIWQPIFRALQADVVAPPRDFPCREMRALSRDGAPVVVVAVAMMYAPFRRRFGSLLYGARYVILRASARYFRSRAADASILVLFDDTAAAAYEGLKMRDTR